MDFSVSGFVSNYFFYLEPFTSRSLCLNSFILCFYDTVDLVYKWCVGQMPSTNTFISWQPWTLFFFFLSSKPSKRTLQMIFIISSFFGERCKLKTSFVSKSNMMTELMIYHIAQRVPLPEYLLFDCPNSVSVLLWHTLGWFSSVPDTHQTKMTKSSCSWWERKDSYNLRVERSSNLIKSNSLLNKWTLFPAALIRDHPALVWSPPGSNCPFLMLSFYLCGEGKWWERSSLERREAPALMTSTLQKGYNRTVLTAKWVSHTSPFTHLSLSCGTWGKSSSARALVSIKCRIIRISLFL